MIREYFVATLGRPEGQSIKRINSFPKNRELIMGEGRMNEILNIWIFSIDWHQKLILIADLGTRFVIALAVSFILGKTTGRIIYIIAERSAENDLFPFNKSLIKKGVYKRLTGLLPFAFLYLFSEFIFADTPKFGGILERFLVSILAAYNIYLLNAFIDALDHYYQEFEVSRKNSIKGYLQMIKIFLTIAGIIVIISSLFNKSPWGIISGFGAMTALLILVFRDWILGFVASIEINSNNLVVIGDSIEMERYGVNGEVIDISLSTVKVKNWDNTISMIPAYSLISETFKNWHGVKESGGRRIKRVLYLDINSITLPDDKTLKRIKKLTLLKGSDELKELSRTVKTDRGDRLNKSGITNVGIFRKYVELYLESHDGINVDKLLMAKLLEPTARGIPLQIYAFTTIIDVVEYETVMAHIFEHLIAVAPEFGLRLI